MVPKNWEKKYLKDILSEPIKNGYSPVPVENATGFWVLSLGALGDNGIKLSEVKPVIPNLKIHQTQIKCGDFLVSRSNTPEKVGRSILFKGEIDNCSYPDLMMRFRVDELKANPLFIEQKLRSHEIRSYFKNNAAGSSSTMVKINKGVLEKTPLLLPSLKEQNKIVIILSTWDKIISVTEELLINTKKKKKSLMQKLLTGKVRLSGFNEGWNKIKMKDIFHPESISSLAKDYSIYSVTKNGLVNQREYFKKSVASADISKYKVVKPGRFVMSGLNFWMGAVDVNMECFPVTVSPAYKVFKISDDFSVAFVYHFIKSDIFLRALEESSIIGASIVRRNFSKNIFNNYCFSLPNINEQKYIAQVLDLADNEIIHIQRKVEYLKKEKKALMQQLLTGKRRVKVEAA